MFVRRSIWSIISNGKETSRSILFLLLFEFVECTEWSLSSSRFYSPDLFLLLMLHKITISSSIQTLPLASPSLPGSLYHFLTTLRRFGRRTRFFLDAKADSMSWKKTKLQFEDRFSLAMPVVAPMSFQTMQAARTISIFENGPRFHYSFDLQYQTELPYNFDLNVHVF